MTRRRWFVAGGVLALVLLVVGVIVATRGDDDGGDAPPTIAEEPRTAEPCELVTEVQLAAWLGGSDWAQDEERTDGPTCAYREVEGPGFLSVQVAETPTRELFATLRAGQQAVPLTGIGDEAWWWEQADLPGGTLVLRVAGRAVTIELGGQYPDQLATVATTTTVEGDDGATSTSAGTDGEGPVRVEPTPQEVTVIVLGRLRLIGEQVAKRLDPLPFTVPTPEEGESTVPQTPGEAACDVLTLDAVSTEVGVDRAQSTLETLGERGCLFTGPGGINIAMEVTATGADASALEVGRSMTSDGETIVWEPVPVEDIGDGAVWMVDPVTGVSGELYALFDGVLVRLTSSASSPDGIRERAEAVMRYAGPVLAALDVPGADDGAPASDPAATTEAPATPATTATTEAPDGSGD